MIDYKKFESIRNAAIKCHDDVNQKYGGNSYSYHLDMVMMNVISYKTFQNDGNDDLLYSLLFAAYFHDAIEDARKNYNDIIEISSAILGKNNDEMNVYNAELVFALTEEKGRNRSERHCQRYLDGICSVEYAPFVKLCDVCANGFFALSNKTRMYNLYKEEYPRYRNYFVEHSDKSKIEKIIEYGDDLFGYTEEK